MVFLTTQFWSGRSPSSSSSSKTQSRPEKTHPKEQLYRRFSLREIKSATQNFDNSLVIGLGGFGKVYKGVIENKTAAIKRLASWSNQGATEFWTEIEMLSRLRHRHLVSLIGYCNDEDELILVYEFVPLGSLHDHLHGNGMYLSWMQRLNICIGAARGLEYLHDWNGGGVIHRDVKSSNILLELNSVAKVSDFGLSRIGLTNQAASYVNTFVKGTFGYLDPNYLLTGQVTRKSDVYAFGVVLFEVLCGRPAADASLPREQRALARWAQDCIKDGKLKTIVDSSIRGQISPKCLKKFAHIASRCLHIEPEERPTMAEVVTVLDSALCLQEKTESSIATAPIDKSSTALTRKMKSFFLPSVGAKAGSSIATTSASLPTNTTETIPTTISVPPSSLCTMTSTLVGDSTSTTRSSISQEFPVTQPTKQHLPITSTLTSSARESPTLNTPAKGSAVKLALQNSASEMAALSLWKTSAPQPSSSVPFVMPLEPWKSNKTLVEGVWVHQDYKKLWTKIVALHPRLLSNLHISSDMMKSMAAEEVCFLISTIVEGRPTMAQVVASIHSILALQERTDDDQSSVISPGVLSDTDRDEDDISEAEPDADISEAEPDADHHEENLPDLDDEDQLRHDTETVLDRLSASSPSVDQEDRVEDNHLVNQNGDTEPTVINTVHDTQEFFWRGHCVSQSAGKLLHLVEQHYPQTFQCLKIRRAKIWEAYLETFEQITTRFLNLVVGDLTDEALVNLLTELEELVTYGFDMTWAIEWLDIATWLRDSESLKQELSRLEEAAAQLDSVIERLKQELAAAETQRAEIFASSRCKGGGS